MVNVSDGDGAERGFTLPREHPVSQYPEADFAPQSVWIIPVESRHQIVLLTFVFHARQISELRLQAPEH